MSKKHTNIPIFIPHLGCPQNCTFCNQHTISGEKYTSYETVDEKIASALSTSKSSATDTQIAFFGGSFTAIPREKMIGFLKIAEKYVRSGQVDSIRISTRPDFIDDDICRLLKNYGVKNVELGLQSMNDNVLKKCRRGHTVKDTLTAVSVIKKYGLLFGAQMMVGLPGSSENDETETAKEAVKLGAVDSRIYPLLVLRDTPLSLDKDYTSLTLEEAISRTAKMIKILDDSGVKILRIGLCESDGLRSGEVLSGPYHPSFGELAISEVYKRNMVELIEENKINKNNKLVFAVGKGKTSSAIGNKKSNIIYLTDNYEISKIKIIENNDIFGYNIKLM